MLRWTAFFSLLAVIAFLFAFVGILIGVNDKAQIVFVVLFLILLVTLLLGISPLKNKQRN